MNETPYFPFIRGVVSPLVTPFKNEMIDRIGLMSLIEWQIRQGVNGLAPCSLAGESPTLSAEERTYIISTCVEIAEGKIPVIAGTGTNCTETSIGLTRQAKASGADAALIAVPYYNKPTQQGIIRHFESIAAAVDLPIVIYNSPSHQSVDLTPLTITRLAAMPSIIGIVDVSGDLSRLDLYRSISKTFTALSGDDRTALAFNLSGGHGALSSLANVLPRLTASMFNAGLGGNAPAAFTLQDRLRPMIEALGTNENPANIKYALHLLRGIDPQVRLPLVQPEPETREAMRLALEPLMQCNNAHPFEIAA